jgi:hypothetical protein
VSSSGATAERNQGAEPVRGAAAPGRRTSVYSGGESWGCTRRRTRFRARREPFGALGDALGSLGEAPRCRARSTAGSGTRERN